MYDEILVLIRERVNTLSEHNRSTNVRSYRKSKRAEDEARTRARIVDAAEALHASVGPAGASISAVAELAGVTRSTVYRHFPDDEALFLACSGQWLSRQELPQPESWRLEDLPVERVRAGLADLYRYFRAGQEMLANMERDAALVPDRIRRARLDRERVWLEALLQGLPGRRRRTVRAAVAHAAAFGTWRSLCREQGLSDREAVSLMTTLVAVSIGAT